MGHRRALNLGAILLALTAGTAALAGVHPWLAELSALPSPTTDRTGVTEPEIHWFDAADIGVRLHADPAHVGLTASVSARYRLDAPAHLAGKRADAADLMFAAAMRRELERREARLHAYADRCERFWRAHQRALLARGLETVTVPGERAYLEALLALLATAGAPPADADAGLCRLEQWVPEVAFMADAPVALAAAAEARLAERAAAVPDAAAPASAWLDLELRVAGASPSRVAVRVGLDLPFTTSSGGGVLSLGFGERAPEVALGWSLEALDERIMRAHRRVLAPRGAPPDLEAERREHFRRRVLEHRLARADADRRWDGSCGDARPETLAGCLRTALEGPGPPRDDLLAAIDAEMGAVHAFVAVVDASGADLVDLLSRPEDRARDP